MLRGSTIIVEILPDEEIKTAGGLIISAPTDHTRGNSVNAHKLQTGRVLMTGPGYWSDELADYEALEVSPGSIVILPQYATEYVSTFPGIQRPTENKLGLVKMDSILAYYPSEEAYNLAKSKLN